MFIAESEFLGAGPYLNDDRCQLLVARKIYGKPYAQDWNSQNHDFGPIDTKNSKFSISLRFSIELKRICLRRWGVRRGSTVEHVVYKRTS